MTMATHQPTAVFESGLVNQRLKLSELGVTGPKTKPAILSQDKIIMQVHAVNITKRMPCCMST